MTNDERVEIIKEYNHLQNLKRSINDLQEELEILEEKPEIKRYLEKKEQLENLKEYNFYDVINLDNKEILKKAIDSIEITNEDSIYIYSETYKIDVVENDGELCPVERITEFSDSEFSYHKYINLETEQEIKINSEQVPNFEKDNIVLYPPKDVDSTTYFSKIKDMYFGEAIKYGCNKALEKVLYRRNLERNFRKDNK